MKQVRNIAVLVCLLYLVVAWNVVAAQEYASMNVTPEHIEWRPLAANGGVALSVSGPHNVSLVRKYEAGASPSIGLADDEGHSLPNGQYSYELQFTPVTGTVTRSEEELSSVPSVVDSMVQSGSFRVVDGKFLVPSSVAEGPGVRALPRPGQGP